MQSQNGWCWLCSNNPNFMHPKLGSPLLPVVTLPAHPRSLETGRGRRHWPSSQSHRQGVKRTATKDSKPFPNEPLTRIPIRRK